MRFKADAAFPGHLFCTDLSPLCAVSLQSLLPLEFAIGILLVLPLLCFLSANPSLGCAGSWQRNVLFPVSEEQHFQKNNVLCSDKSIFHHAACFYLLGCFYCKLLEWGLHPWLYRLSWILWAIWEGELERKGESLPFLMVSFVCFLSKSIHPVFLFPCLIFHLWCLFRNSFAVQDASLWCVCFYGRACLKLVMLLAAKLLHILKNQMILLGICYARSCAETTCSIWPGL